MRACNKCHMQIMQEWIGFEGEFPDWNYELDLCTNCANEFKFIVDKFCDVQIDTNTKLTEEEKAEREPVSKAMKKLREKKEEIKNDSSLFKRYV